MDKINKDYKRRTRTKFTLNVSLNQSFQIEVDKSLSETLKGNPLSNIQENLLHSTETRCWRM